jgi:hypothetical protein
MPFPLALIPLAISAATSIYQGVKGAKQKREAARLQAEADQQEASNLSDARRMALTGIPQEQYQAALQNIYRNQSAGLGALRDRRSALAGVPALQQTTNDALMNLASQDANARRSAERVALQQGNRVAGLTGQRAQNMLQSGQQMTGAAMNNGFNAASYAAIVLAQEQADKKNGSGSSLFGLQGLGSNPNGNSRAGFGGIYSGLGGNNSNSAYYAQPY